MAALTSGSIYSGEYRTIGTATNNFVCFGTTNQADCIAEPDTYMYRVVGLDQNYNVKLIKYTSYGDYAWDEAEDTNVWAETDLYNTLNTTFLSSLGDWQTRVLNHTWNAGGIYGPYDTDIYTEEQATQISAKIGLMTVNDYYYYDDTSWFIKDIATNTDNEWTMTPYLDENWGFYYTFVANVFAMDATGLYAVRPVFYISADEIIASGDGSITNPFMLEA